MTTRTRFEVYRHEVYMQLYTFARDGSPDPIFAAFYNLADDRPDTFGAARFSEDMDALRSGEWQPEDDNFPELPTHPGNNGREDMLLNYRTTKKEAEEWRYGDPRGFTLIETGETN